MTRVKSYVRVENGKSVTVASYTNTVNPGQPIQTPEKTPLTLARPKLAAKPGVFPGGRAIPGIFIQHVAIKDPAPSAHLNSSKSKPAKKSPTKKAEPKPKPKPVKEGGVTWKGGQPFVKNAAGKMVPASRDELAAHGSKRI